jgi:hypothetical protein
MKTYASILGLLLLTSVTVAQTTDEKIPDQKTLFNDLTSSYGIVDISYSQPHIGNTSMPGFGITFGAVLNDFWYTGLHFDVSTTSDLTLGNPAVQVINPRYTYLFIGWHNEFILFPSSAVNISFPVRLGVGGVTYSDRYFEGWNRAQIDQDYFFVAEPGVKLNVNLWKNIGITGGVAYRLASGVDRAGSDADFSREVYHVGLRFKFWE